MSIPSETDVHAILGDFERRLRVVIDRAWDEWMDCELRGRLIFSRAKSDVIFDFIARHALAEFGADSDIHVIAKHSTVRFLFRDQVLVRFKKGNAKGVGSNIETQATLDFIDPQRTLPGMLADVFKVEVCYQPDRLGTQIKEVAVVARNRTKRVWAYLLAAEQGAEIVPLQPHLGDVTPPVVTPRKSSDESKEVE
jgi:hypothetical protein